MSSLELEGEVELAFQDGRVKASYELKRNSRGTPEDPAKYWRFDMMLEHVGGVEMVSVVMYDSGDVSSVVECPSGIETARYPFVIAECTEKMEEIPNLRKFCKPLLEIAMDEVEVSDEYIN